MAQTHRFTRIASQAEWSRGGGTFVTTYRADRHNSCPVCTRSNWWVGRLSAECGFCGATLSIPVQASYPMVAEHKVA